MTPNYGRAIGIVRQARGLSQTELAERAGIGASQMSLIERGLRNPSMGALNHLVVALDMPMLHLVALAGGCEVDPLLAQSVLASLLKYAPLDVDSVLAAGVDYDEADEADLELQQALDEGDR